MTQMQRRVLSGSAWIAGASLGLGCLAGTPNDAEIGCAFDANQPACQPQKTVVAADAKAEGAVADAVVEGGASTDASLAPDAKSP